MNNFNMLDLKQSETDSSFTLKNSNTTIGFIRFNDKGEIEYVFVNPIFRKRGIAKKLLSLVKKKQERNSFSKNQLVLLVQH